MDQYTQVQTTNYKWKDNWIFLIYIDTSNEQAAQAIGGDILLHLNHILIHHINSVGVYDKMMNVTLMNELRFDIGFNSILFN